MGIVRLFMGAICALFANTLHAQAVELKIFEWEGYISTYSEKFEAFAKSQGKDIRLSLLKKPDGSVYYISSADEIFKEARQGSVDIVTPTHNYYRGDQEKLLKIMAPLDTAQLRHWPDLPKEITGLGYAALHDKVHAAPLLGGSYGLAYNATRIKTPPASWSVLLDPAVAGRISVTSAQFEANVFVAAIMSGHSYADLYDADKLDRKKIQPLLNRMAANSKAFWETNPDPALMAESIDYITDYWFGVAIANAQGQNWVLAQPQEGETLWIDNISIAGHVVHDPSKYAAAHLLIDFMLSPEIQADISKRFGSVTMNPNAAKHMTPDEAKRYRVGDATFFRADRMWQPMPSRTRNLYRAMWSEALSQAGRADELAKLK